MGGKVKDHELSFFIHQKFQIQRFNLKASPHWDPGRNSKGKPLEMKWLDEWNAEQIQVEKLDTVSFYIIRTFFGWRERDREKEDSDSKYTSRYVGFFVMAPLKEWHGRILPGHSSISWISASATSIVQALTEDLTKKGRGDL